MNFWYLENQLGKNADVRCFLHRRVITSNSDAYTQCLLPAEDCAGEPVSTTYTPQTEIPSVKSVVALQ
jgi:hypothetical protein